MSVNPLSLTLLLGLSQRRCGVTLEFMVGILYDNPNDTCLLLHIHVKIPSLECRLGLVTGL